METIVLYDDDGCHIEDCIACRLRVPNVTQVIPGAGNFDAKYMIIGEAPGEQENKTGFPFYEFAPSGQSVRDSLADLGIGIDQCFITNVAKCWPQRGATGKQKKPGKVPTEACRHWLEAEIQTVNPDVIVTLGGAALKWFFPTESIDNVHGQVFDWKGKTLVALYHPAAGMHNPGLSHVIERDFKILARAEEIHAEKGKVEIPFEVLTPETFDDFFLYLRSYEGMIAVDFETTDLRTHVAGIVGTAIATKERAAYVPQKFPVQSYLPFLEQLPRVVAHNAKYEHGIMLNNGVAPKHLLDDTMILAAVLNETPKGLKSIVLREFGYQMTNIEELIGENNKHQLSMSEVPIKTVAPYACADAWFTLKLWDRYSERMTDQDWDVYNIEKRLVPVAAKMELQGCKLDVEAIQAAADELEPMHEELVAEIRSYVAITSQKLAENFNPNSPPQVLEYMQRIGAHISETGKDTMHEIAPDYPIATKIVRARHLDVLKGRYAARMRAMIPRAYGSVNPTGTKTGRFSYSGWKQRGEQWGINLQTIPKLKVWEDYNEGESNLVRRCFIPDDGKVLVEFDYSQMELRMAAHISRDATMCTAYRNGVDIHTLTAKGMYGNPDVITDSMRRIAKILNFGSLYEPNDRAASYVVRRNAAEAGIYLLDDECLEFIRAKRDTYPGIVQYYDDTRWQLQQHGQVETIFGRVLKLSWLTGNTKTIWKANNDTHKIAVNMPIQGSCGDMIKIALTEMDLSLPSETDMIWTVHDSALVQTPPERVDGIARWGKGTMEGVASLRVPIIVDVKVGKNLADMKEVKVEV